MSSGRRYLYTEAEINWLRDIGIPRAKGGESTRDVARDFRQVFGRTHSVVTLATKMGSVLRGIQKLGYTESGRKSGYSISETEWMKREWASGRWERKTDLALEFKKRFGGNKTDQAVLCKLSEVTTRSPRFPRPRSAPYGGDAWSEQGSQDKKYFLLSLSTNGTQSQLTELAPRFRDLILAAVNFNQAT